MFSDHRKKTYICAPCLSFFIFYKLIMSKILIIDDEVQIRSLLARMLGLEGYEGCQAGDCKAAIRQLEIQQPDVALCDVFLPDGNGVDLVLNIKKTAPNVEVILLTAHGNIPDGVQAIKNGAFDYITKGDDNNKIIPLISRAVEKAKMNVRLEKLEKKVSQLYSFDSILGESKVLKEAVMLAQKVSVTDVPVLLTGETGTGKEVFAQAIHYNSKRSKQSFVAVNCSSFSKELLESEMFGHKAGSFTGALKDKKGLFEEANNGTIFLDEIGELAPHLQSKLLRALQERKIRRIGGKQEMDIDVRIISATNRSLEDMIEDNSFREDLYYRLNIIPIHIPPLRAREGDIERLTRFFVEDICKNNEREVLPVSEAAIQKLETYSWPGNIRELKNVLERAVFMSTHIITEQDILLDNNKTLTPQRQQVRNEANYEYPVDLPAKLRDLEMKYIIDAVGHFGSYRKAARNLNISHTSLTNKYKERDVK